MWKPILHNYISSHQTVLTDGKENNKTCVCVGGGGYYCLMSFTGVAIIQILLIYSMTLINTIISAAIHMWV